MPNRTISVPDDVVAIIDALEVPFSRWVTDQLRLHSAQTKLSFAKQLEADSALTGPERRPSLTDARRVGARMGRSAPW